MGIHKSSMCSQLFHAEKYDDSARPMVRDVDQRLGFFVGKVSLPNALADGSQIDQMIA